LWDQDAANEIEACSDNQKHKELQATQQNSRHFSYVTLLPVFEH